MIFRKYGNTAQLQIETANDLQHLNKLKPSLWAVTSAPKAHFHCDPIFLTLLDQKDKGRIRVADVQIACRWLLETLSDRSPITSKSDLFYKETVNKETSDGMAAIRGAEFLNNHEDKDSPIDVARIRKFRNSYVKRPPNGDGIISLDDLANDEEKKWFELIIRNCGSRQDLSGKAGIGLEEILQFENDLKQTAQWEKLIKEIPHEVLYPFGEESDTIITAIQKVIPAIDLYFTQCRLLSRNPDLDKKTLYPKELLTIDPQDSSALASVLNKTVPNQPNTQGVLELKNISDSMWAPIFEIISSKICEKSLGKTQFELTVVDWDKIKRMISPWIQANTSKPKSGVDKIPEAERQNFLNSEINRSLKNQIQADLSTAGALKDLEVLEKLLLFQANMIRFCSNFVNLSELYDPDEKALFEEGKLIIDGYTLSFTMKVENRTSHKAYAIQSKIFIVYAEVTDRDSGGIKFEIAAPVTNGQRRSFRVGKRGIFRDYQNKEWDAKIIEIIENPININEAVKAPFIRAFEAIQKRFEKYVSAPIEDLEKSATKGFDLKQPSTANTNKDEENKNTKNILLAGSVAIAALGSSLAYVVKTIAAIPFFNIVASIGGLIFTAWLAAFILAWLSLRKRDLTSFMEAANWAINLRMPLVRHLRKLFTRGPKLPKESTLIHYDFLPKLLEKAERNDSKDSLDQ